MLTKIWNSPPANLMTVAISKLS